MAKEWILLILVIWAEPIYSTTDPTYLDSIERILPILNPSPSQISTVFCGNIHQEYNLIKLFSTDNNSGPIFTPTSTIASYSGQFQHLFIVDINQCHPSQLLPIFSKNEMSLSFSRWLIIDTGKPSGAIDIQQIQEVFRDVELSQSSEIMFLEYDAEFLKVLMVYKMDRVHSSTLVFEEMGYFPNASSSHFIDTRIHKVTSMRRKDMKGVGLPIASVLRNPDSINHYFDFVDIEVDTVGKSGHRLGVSVLQFMNATPEIILNNSWGSFNATSQQWTGMLGDIISGRAEFGGTPSFIVSERADVIEYMSVSLESWTKIVFRAPKLSYTTNVYLLPFAKSVWVAAIILFAVITLLLLAASIGEWKLSKTGATEEQRPRFIDILFVIFSAICNQGSSFNVHSVGGRIILLSCLVLVVCLFVSYCAFIVVLLQSPSTNIKTAQDVLNSRMQIGAEDTVYNRYWLKV